MEPRHPVLDEVGVHQLLAVVDHLLVERSAESLRGGPEILGFDEGRVDRLADVADGNEVLDRDGAGRLIDADLDADDADLPEGR